MTKLRSFRGLLVGLAGLALLLGGFALASNMGFKGVPQVAGGDNLDLSLPWNNNYAKANELLNDIRSTDDIESVSKFTAGGNLLTWVYGGNPPDNFDIEKSEAYIVKAGPGGISNFVLVGSHDPNFTVSVPADDNFSLAAPWHGTHTRANELLNDIRSSQGADAIDSVSKFTAAGNLLTWVYGGNPPDNFDLDLFLGVIVKAGSAGITDYVYPHY